MRACSILVLFLLKGNLFLIFKSISGSIGLHKSASGSPDSNCSTPLCYKMKTPRDSLKGISVCYVADASIEEEVRKIILAHVRPSKLYIKPHNDGVLLLMYHEPRKTHANLHVMFSYVQDALKKKLGEDKEIFKKVSDVQTGIIRTFGLKVKDDEYYNQFFLLSQRGGVEGQKYPLCEGVKVEHISQEVQPETSWKKKYDNLSNEHMKLKYAQTEEKKVLTERVMHLEDRVMRLRRKEMAARAKYEILLENNKATEIRNDGLQDEVMSMDVQNRTLLQKFESVNAQNRVLLQTVEKMSAQNRFITQKLEFAHVQIKGLHQRIENMIAQDKTGNMHSTENMDVQIKNGEKRIERAIEASTAMEKLQNLAGLAMVKFRLGETYPAFWKRVQLAVHPDKNAGDEYLAKICRAVNNLPRTL